MKTITQKEFDDLVKQHKLWLEDKTKGERLDLSNYIIEGIICEYENLSYSNFNHSEFYDSKFNHSKFYGSEFNDSKLNNSVFNGSVFNNSEFYHSEFNNSVFSNSKFNDSVFNYSEFCGSKFYYPEFNNSVFNNSNFNGSTFNNSVFNHPKFYDCIGNGKEIVSIQAGAYKVVMLKGVIAIGCEQHTVKKWLLFSDKELFRMDGDKGLDWWNKYSKTVFDLHKTHFGDE